MAAGLAVQLVGQQALQHGTIALGDGQGPGVQPLQRVVRGAARNVGVGKEAAHIAQQRHRFAPLGRQAQSAARALDDGDGKSIASALVLGALLGRSQFAAHGGQRGLVVGNDGAARRRGLGAHHAQQAAIEQRKPLVQAQAVALNAAGVRRVVAAVGVAQALHGR